MVCYNYARQQAIPESEKTYLNRPPTSENGVKKEITDGRLREMACQLSGNLKLTRMCREMEEKFSVRRNTFWENKNKT